MMEKQPSPTFNQRFSKNLKACRLKAGYDTAADFAEAMQLSYPTYAAYENGTREPKLELLVRIAAKLNVTTDRLLQTSYTEEEMQIKHYIEKCYRHNCKIIDFRFDSAYIDSNDFVGLYFPLSTCRKLLKEADELRDRQLTISFADALNDVCLQRMRITKLVDELAVQHDLAALMEIDYDQLCQAAAKAKSAFSTYQILTFRYFTGYSLLDNPELDGFIRLAYEYYGSDGWQESFRTEWERQYGAQYEFCEDWIDLVLDPVYRAMDHVPQKRLYYYEGQLAKNALIDYYKMVKKYSSATAYELVKDSYFNNGWLPVGSPYGEDKDILTEDGKVASIDAALY